MVFMEYKYKFCKLKIIIKLVLGEDIDEFLNDNLFLLLNGFYLDVLYDFFIDWFELLG